MKKTEPGKECYHCRQWVAEKDKKNHDCWSTTEEKLTQDLSEDLMEAWLRLRETVTAFGEQRVYASHKSIMFSRRHCYFFVRPKKSALEICFFLGKTVKSPLVRKSQAASKVKVGHIVHVTHRDEVEPPLTEWLKEAYEVSENLKAASAKRQKSPPRKKGRVSPANRASK